jgi:DNA repair protein RecN (Recombination protein N)
VLRQLELRGLGVIANATVTFSRGLTVISGETGAGKTMLLTALGYLMGQRADSALVRDQTALVSGLFELPQGHPVAELAASSGASIEDDELIVTRSLTSAGRSRVHLGGVLVPVNVLTTTVGRLVAVHGQADQLRLRSPEEQRDLLDRFGQTPLEPYRQLYDAAVAVEKQLAQLATQERLAADESEALTRALSEIDAVHLLSGEETSIVQSIQRLANAEDLRQATAFALSTLQGDDRQTASQGAEQLVDAAARALERASTSDSELTALAGRTRELAYLATDLSSDLAVYAASLEFDPNAMTTLQERRAAITALLRKYGPTADHVLAWADSARDRLAALTGGATQLKELQTRANRLAEQRDQAAHALSTARLKAAKGLAALVNAELGGLAMGGALFEIAVEPTGRAGPDGQDAVEFRFSAHQGVSRPLARGASGGELSRLMLALEVAALQSGDLHQAVTMVFDEVDQGVGGVSALALASRLARLAQGHQVLVVTHLPQIAAAANNHLRVVKDGQITQIFPVDGAERRAEIARMLAGLGDSEAALEHADELLARDWVGQSTPP